METFQSWYEMYDVAPDATIDEIDEVIKARIMRGEHYGIDSPQVIAEMQITDEIDRKVYDLVLKEGEVFAEKYHNYCYLRYGSEMNSDKELVLLNELIAEMKNPIAGLYHHRGFLLAEKEEFSAAISDFEETLKLEPENLDVLIAEARCRGKIEGLEKARPLFDKILTLDKMYFNAAVEYGKMLIDAGNDEAALAYWDDKIEEAGEEHLLLHGMLVHEKLLYWGRQSEREKSMAAQEELIELCENKMTHPEYPHFLIALKDWAEEHGLQEAVAQYDSYLEKYMYVGDVAEANIRREIANTPEVYLTLRNYAREAWRHGFDEKSFAILEGEMETRSDNLTQWIEFASMRAMLAHLSEDFDTSKELFEQISSRATNAENKDAAYKALILLSEELKSAEMNDMADWFKDLSKEVFTGQKKEGCFIATAVYGDYDHPQVLKLRRIRDLSLRQSAAGRLFIRLYYRFSPFWAEKLKGTVVAKVLVRRVLDLFVGK